MSQKPVEKNHPCSCAFDKVADTLAIAQAKYASQPWWRCTSLRENRVLDTTDENNDIDLLQHQI